MFKYILRLLAASTSLVALLLVTNSSPAIAATTVAPSATQFGTPAIDLNVMSVSLQSSSDADSLLQHLGCTCATCVQNIEQSDRQI